jgi:hypothetical protein
VSTSSNAVPQFVNQTYTTVSAPEQTTVNVPPSVPGPAGPAGPAGPPGPAGTTPPGSTSPPPKTPNPQPPAYFQVSQGAPGTGYIWNPNNVPGIGPSGTLTYNYTAGWRGGGATPAPTAPVGGGGGGLQTILGNLLGGGIGGKKSGT